MDTLTHTLIGAAVGHIVAGRHFPRVALILGALVANIPDFDVFIRFSDPVLTHQFHRHFTHALIMVPVLAVLATVPFLFARRLHTHAPLLLLTAFLACATHTLLDACTSYGTLMLWPFSYLRISWDVVAVFDPLVTLPLLIAFIMAWRHFSYRVSLAALMCVVCYLGLGAWQHHRAMVAQETLMASRGHNPSAVRVMPTLGNIVLWRSIYQYDHHLQCDALRIFPGTSPRIRAGANVSLVTDADLVRGGATPSNVDAFRRFAWFADSYVAYAPSRPDVLADMRYSLKADAFMPVWGISLSQTQTKATWVNLASNAPQRSAQILWRDLFTGRGYTPLGATVTP